MGITACCINSVRCIKQPDASRGIVLFSNVDVTHVIIEYLGVVISSLASRWRVEGDGERRGGGRGRVSVTQAENEAVVVVDKWASSVAASQSGTRWSNGA
jgi:hypothetical protein